VTLQGKAQVEAALNRAVESFEARLGAAMYVVANNVMVDAKRITPHDTGTLMASGYVALPEKRGSGLVVELGFGGFAKDYAVPQHEREDWNPSHDPGRQAKYLSEPVDNERIKLISDIAEAMRINARAGGMPTHPDQGGKKEKVKRTKRQKAAAARRAARALKPRKTRRRK
jgi:hypothetical protein